MYYLGSEKPLRLVYGTFNLATLLLFTRTSNTDADVIVKNQKSVIPAKAGIRNIQGCANSVRFRAVEEINYLRWRRFLLPHSRRDEASISRYVSFIATKKVEQKTSKMGYFIFSTALILSPPLKQRSATSHPSVSEASS